VGRFFCPGPFYYYVIDSPTQTFDYVSDSVRTTLGVAPADFSMSDMLEGIHPEDISFMTRCEDMVADFFQNKITPEQIASYKVAYSLREQTASGEYRLFLIQTATLRATDKGTRLKIFGLHTDITHLTTINNHKLSLIGLNGQPSYLSIDVEGSDEPYYKDCFNPLTRREYQIIGLFGRGFSAKQIADKLSISVETVVSHKKNAMARVGGKNITELVARCVRNGYI